MELKRADYRGHEARFFYVGKHPLGRETYVVFGEIQPGHCYVAAYRTEYGCTGWDRKAQANVALEDLLTADGLEPSNWVISAPSKIDWVA